MVSRAVFRDHELAVVGWLDPNNDAALVNASCTLGAVTMPRCSVFLRTISMREPCMRVIF
jgi:hypothetical protein